MRHKTNVKIKIKIADLSIIILKRITLSFSIVKKEKKRKLFRK